MPHRWPDNLLTCFVRLTNSLPPKWTQLLTTLPAVELRGAQRPRVSNIPQASSSAGLEAIELAASAGLVLDEWQQFALIAALGERDDAARTWASFEVGLVVSRQNGKGSILEARELAGLFLFDEQLILHSAHEFKTAAEAFRRVLMLVENSDDLRKRVKKVRTSHGDEGIELMSGARLRFVARSTGSGRGFSGDCVILDEAYKLPQEAIGALLPTLSARPNPQLWYTSSAGHRDSEVLRAVRDRGMTGNDQHLTYLEWSAEPSLALDDPEAWVQANPALGIRISSDHVAREFSAMPEGEFKRERLGIWDETEGENAALPVETWLTLADLTSSALDPVAFGLDVSPDGYSCIASAGSRSDGRVHVEVIEHRPGTAWVADRLAELTRRWSPSAVVLDVGSPAGALLPDLERVGLNLTKVAGREMAQSSVAFSSLVHDHGVRHLDQPSLNSAVAAAKRRALGDLWAFGRRGSFTDISPLIATALAAWGHAQNVGRAPSIVDPWSLEDEHDA